MQLFKFAFSLVIRRLVSYAKFTRLTALCTLCFLFKFYCADKHADPPSLSSIVATDLQILPPSAFKEFLYHLLIAVLYSSGLVFITHPKRTAGLRP